jgi:O-antigen/teichoic acid export membrane protein
MNATARVPLTMVQLAFHPATDDLGRRVARGAGFTFLGIAVRTAITIGSMSILARLLAPADFGHVAMATVVTELAAMFANFGFGSILIQKPHISRLQLDTVFWASSALGVALTVVVFGLSFFSELVFADPVAGQLLRVLCLTFVLDEMTVVPSSLLSRLLQFRILFFVQLIMLPCRAGVAVALAWSGFGVWSLVAGALAGSIAQWAAYTFIVRYWPRFRFSRSFLATTWKTNGSYFGGGFLFYLNSNIDLAIVGRALGAGPLGFYQNARSLSDEVRARIAAPLQRVLFPAFAVMQDDLARFREGVIRSSRLLALIVIPIGFGIAAVAEELVPLLYGQQWLAMIPILKIISVGSGIRAATTVSNSIFNATNRVGLWFRLNLVFNALFVLFIVVGSRWGLLGVAFAVLSGAAMSVVIFRISLGVIELRTPDLWKMLGAPLLASMLMAGAVVFCRTGLLDPESAVAFRLGILCLVGSLVYAAGMFVLSQAHLQELLLAISHVRNRARSAGSA